MLQMMREREREREGERRETVTVAEVMSVNSARKKTAQMKRGLTNYWRRRKRTAKVAFLRQVL